MKKRSLTVIAFSFLLMFTAMISASNAAKKKSYSKHKSPKNILTINQSDSIGFFAGKKIYDKVCSKCHRIDGKGVPGIFPPLANSDYLLADKNRAIQQVLHGVENEIIVNKTPYHGIMPPHGDKLNNQEIVNVLNYVLSSWGNEGETVTLDEVEKLR